jgi:ribosomal protein L40E
MYQDKLVAAVKVAGKVLREFEGNKVYIPYGSEYSIYLKNTHSTQALVDIKVDGQPVVTGLILKAHTDTTIDRFVKDLDRGNRLKFIERTEKIEQHRGINPLDGLLEINFKFAADLGHYGFNFPWPPWPKCPTTSSPIWTLDTTSLKGCAGTDGPQGPTGYYTSRRAEAGAVNYCSTLTRSVPDEKGITVPGSVSDQKFKAVTDYSTYLNSHVMVIQLLGECKQKQVVVPVTVKHKIECVTCGTINPPHAKFCSECGTALEII